MKKICKKFIKFKKKIKVFQKNSFHFKQKWTNIDFIKNLSQNSIFEKKKTLNNSKNICVLGMGLGYETQTQIILDVNVPYYLVYSLRD